jgi:hypothetical protein
MSTMSLTTDTPLETAQPATMEGGMMFWAGSSFGTASFVQYLILSGHIVLPHPALMGLIWMAAAFVFVLFAFVFKVGSDRLMLQQPAVRRFRAVWGTLILGAAVVIAALMIMMVKFGAGANTSFIISPIALSVYGIGWRVSGVMTGKAWAKWLSWGAFAGVIGLALLAGHSEQSLAYTAALIVFAILPGLSLLLRPATH